MASASHTDYALLLNFLTRSKTPEVLWTNQEVGVVLAYIHLETLGTLETSYPPLLAPTLSKNGLNFFLYHLFDLSKVLFFLHLLGCRS